VGRFVRQISAEWGAQRIKGLSIAKALGMPFGSCCRVEVPLDRNVATSLIGRSLPKFGPGQLWRRVARRIERKAPAYCSVTMSRPWVTNMGGSCSVDIVDGHETAG
jgi:hypothetical protein